MKIRIKDYIEKYGYEIGYQKLKQNNAISKRFQSYIDRYGIINGIIKYLQICKANAQTLDNFIDKYGEEEGTKRYNNWKKSQDHGSLLFFIKKYGEKEGFKKYNQANIAKSHNTNKTFYSQISQELFEILNLKLNNAENILFATKNTEFSLYNKEFNEKYFYDFCYNKKIIEYNGDFWHANPKIYNESDVVHKNKVAKDIWNYDIRKQSFAKKHGYDVLVIWDSEYKYNKLNVITTCINFLLKK